MADPGVFFFFVFEAGSFGAPLAPAAGSLLAFAAARAAVTVVRVGALPGVAAVVGAVAAGAASGRGFLALCFLGAPFLFLFAIGGWLGGGKERALTRAYHCNTRFDVDATVVFVVTWFERGSETFSDPRP